MVAARGVATDLEICVRFHTASAESSRFANQSQTSHPQHRRTCICVQRMAALANQPIIRYLHNGAAEVVRWIAFAVVHRGLRANNSHAVTVFAISDPSAALPPNVRTRTARPASSLCCHNGLIARDNAKNPIGSFQVSRIQLSSHAK